jgi:hypothetical protein
MKVIYLRVESIRPDPIQYKPYSPTLVPVDDLPVYVKIEVPKEMVVHYPGSVSFPAQCIVLTPEGLAKMMGEIASSIRLVLGA